MDAPGRWAGGFRAWDEHGVYLATGRATGAGRRAAGARGRAARAGRPTGSRSAPTSSRGLFRTARTIEAVARQREALVALGTLAAGLAHEINNPAAAATRAVDALGDARHDAAVLAGPARRPAITADQFARPRRAAPSSSGRSRPAPTRWPSPTARTTLVGLAVAGTASTGSGWSRRRWPRAGVDVAWCERVAAVLAGPALEPGLEWVASTLSAAALLGEVKESTRRISELVAAVKSYSQMDRASRAAHRRDRGAGEHAGRCSDHQLPRRSHRRAGLRRPTCRGSRRSPASSTRSGPTSSTTPSTRWTARARCA